MFFGFLFFDLVLRSLMLVFQLTVPQLFAFFGFRGSPVDGLSPFVLDRLPTAATSLYFLDVRVCVLDAVSSSFFLTAFCVGIFLD